MMMVFGLFVFELRTLPYQQLQLSRNWRHVKNDRVAGAQNGSTLAQVRTS
ncbi:P2 GpU family protein [Klebsiella pneumoniae]|nr:P2 GpU family protein [Klebsiella pneumoniae]